ncbi:unnamed protein product, partial [Prorocentrum cordatum]
MTTMSALEPKALPLLHDVRCAGGSVSEFAALAARRTPQLPKVPDCVRRHLR